MTRATTRRRLLAGMTALAAARAAAPAHAADPAALPAQPGLLVAGPAGSEVGHWAEVIAPALGQRMQGGKPLGCTFVGGADGVTGVNQFQARTNPDGATALLLPGAALLAWLVGDGRVRFDAGSWAPLWGGSSTAIIATRQKLMRGRPVRIPIGTVAGPELQALLALHLIGVEVRPFRAIGDGLRNREADAIYLRGPVSQAALAEFGWQPAASLTGSGTMPDPAFPAIPTARELFAADQSPALVDAYRAVAAAASLDVALILPAVVPAAVLAWWRRSCEEMADDPAVRAAASGVGMEQNDAGVIARQIAAISLDTSSLLALRSLLAERFHWQPS